VSIEPYRSLGLKLGGEKIKQYEYWSNGFHFVIILWRTRG